MIESRQKRTVKQLQYGHGAPGTQATQELWVTRFKTFRQITLKQSLDNPFCGDDLIRFFDSLIKRFGLAQPKNQHQMLQL